MTYPRVTTTDQPSADGSATRATSVPSNPRFPEIEERVLRYWDADGTFIASVENRDAGTDGDNEFVFYDGPPFANGLPHYGHLLTGYVKDIVPRYQTMRGRRVERRFGWDTHGLPAELEAQRQLGLKTKQDILDLGIDRFNEACRTSVLKYTDEWQEYVTRQARWVDFDQRLQDTGPRSYMESCASGRSSPCTTRVLSTRGSRVLPYCWVDETPLSNHELRMDDDVYKHAGRTPSVTVWVTLDPASGRRVGRAAERRGTAAGLDHHAVDAAEPTSASWPSAPTWNTCIVESDVTGERYVLAKCPVGGPCPPSSPQDLYGADVELARGDERVVGRRSQGPTCWADFLHRHR